LLNDNESNSKNSDNQFQLYVTAIIWLNVWTLKYTEIFTYGSVF